MHCRVVFSRLSTGQRYAIHPIMALFKLFICVILLCALQANSSKLHVPRVLLPLFNDVTTNFTLKVTDGGCYKWLVRLLPTILFYDLQVCVCLCTDLAYVSVVTLFTYRCHNLQFFCFFVLSFSLIISGAVTF